MRASDITEPSKASLDVKLREATFDDYEQIAALQTRNGLGCKSREEWEHLWKNNPEYSEYAHWPIGYVAENSDKIVVGYTAWIPLSYHFEGRKVTAGSGWGMAVDEPYRGHTIFLMRRALNPKTSEFQVDASAKPNVARIMDRILIRLNIGGRIPAGDWDNASFWISNYRGFLQSAVKARGWPRPIAYPAAIAMWMRDQLKGSTSWATRAGEDVQLCPCFDERFDRFWEELKQAYPNRFLATRSRQVLEWHFRYALRANNIWILAIGDKSRISAYGIFRRQDNPQLSLKRIRLIDFQAVDGNHQAMVPMLAWAFRRCRQEGIHILEAYGFRSDKQSVIESLHPHRRRLPAWSFFYSSFNQALKQKLQNPEVWDPSHYDGDESL